MTWGCGLDSSNSGKGPIAGYCEHSNEPPGSVKSGKFVDYLRDSYYMESQPRISRLELSPP